LRELLREPRYVNPRRLEHFGYRVFSENGEDGMLQEIFRRIGTTNKKFVEFGTSTGKQCNTHFLLYLGWAGVWIEADDACMKALRTIFRDAIASGTVTVQHSFVTAENINDLIGSAGLSGEIDLLSVDIDGNDFHVCKAVRTVVPRVIVIEFNASFPPPVEYVLPYTPKAQPDGLCFGGSLTSMTKMLGEKGYVLVGTDICGVNAFFVRKDLALDRFVLAGDAESLYNPPRYWLGHGYPGGHPVPTVWRNPRRQVATSR
jgi:hypothetical protein